MKVGIVMGSTSDLGVMEGASAKLKEFGIEYEQKILSAHRTPRELYEWASSLRKRDFNVVIAAAGGAAHLAGVVAAYTTLPVIGVPIRTPSLDGLDSLLAIVQMPSGVPVATVAINGAQNAALLAIEILAVNNQELHQKLINFRKEQTRRVLEANN